MCLKILARRFTKLIWNTSIRNIVNIYTNEHIYTIAIVYRLLHHQLAYSKILNQNFSLLQLATICYLKNYTLIKNEDVIYRNAIRIYLKYILLSTFRWQYINIDIRNIYLSYLKIYCEHQRFHRQFKVTYSLYVLANTPSTYIIHNKYSLTLTQFIFKRESQVSVQ